MVAVVTPVRGFAEISTPVVDSHARILVQATQSHRWQEGEYIVWLLHGGCEIRQGGTVARSRDAVLWVEPGDSLAKRPSKIIAYLENGVWIDFGREGPEHRATGKAAQTYTGQSWLGRFHTLAGIDVRAPDAGPAPSEKPHVFHRSLQALEWDQQGPVRPAQFTAPGAISPGPAPLAVPTAQPTARSVTIRSRSNVRMQIKSYPSPDPSETIVAVNSGVQIVVRGIENVQGIETGAVSIEADRIVFWTTALAGLNLGGETIQQQEGRWEFYLEGNIIFREGDRVIYADRMYYDVNNYRGTVLNAEMLTPVPEYEGLVRLKADVLQQVDRQNFLAYGGALTSSRMGVPKYWFQADNIAFQDVQQPQRDPLTGQPVGDMFTGEVAVEHDLLATSRNNFLYVGGFPVLYWPVLAADLTKPNYYIDGLRLGNDSVFGTQVLVDFDMYQVLGWSNAPDGTEWSVSTDWLEQRGFGLGTDFQYELDGLFGLPAHTKGFLDAWGIHDRGLDNLGRDRRALEPEKRDRGRVLSRSRMLLPNGFQLSSELGFVSDRNFLEQYYEQEWDLWKDQITGLELKQYNGNRTWSLTTSTRLNEFVTQTEWLPRLDHFLLGQSLLFDRLTWHAHSHVGYARLQIADPPLDPVQNAKWTYLPWETDPGGVDPVDREGLRAVTRQELDLPVPVGPLKVVPYIAGELGYWGEDLTGQEVTRAFGQAGVRAALPFWRADPSVQSTLFNLNGLAHKIVFDADFSWNDASQDIERFPLYDPLDDDSNEHFRRRFPFDPFPWFDERFFALRSGTQNWVTAPSAEIADDLMMARVGVRQRWQTKRGLPGHQRIIDWLVLDVEGVFYPDADRDNFGEPFGLLDYDLRWHVGDRFTVLSDGFADIFDDGLRTVSIGGRITRPERSSLYLGYRSIEGPISSNIFSVNLGYRTSEKWIVTAGSSVDFGETGNIGQRFAITRIGESVLLRLGFNVDASRGNVGVTFAIEPRFLPRNRLGRVGGVQLPPPGVSGLE
jgi:hypothetical protein